MAHDTPTALDALADRKRILEENTLLIQQGDTARRETTLWQDALAAVKAELKALGGASLTEKEIKDIVSARLEKRKEALQKEIDTLETRKGIKTVENTGLLAERDGLSSDIEKKKKEHAHVVGDMDTKRATFKLEFEHNNAAIEKSREERAAEETRLAKVRETIRSESSDHAARNTALAEEEKRLGIKGRDLAIYESRIRKAAEKVGMEIIV